MKIGLLVMSLGLSWFENRQMNVKNLIFVLQVSFLTAMYYFCSEQSLFFFPIVVHWGETRAGWKDWIRCSFWEFIATVRQDKAMDRKTSPIIRDSSPTQSQ